MAYTIFNADGSTLIIADGAIDPEFYDTTNKVGVQLVGRNAIDFGAPIAQNFTQMLENFAGPNMPGQNGAVAPLGMLWFDTATGNLKVQNVGGSWASLFTSSGGTITDTLTISTTNANPLILNSDTTLTGEIRAKINNNISGYYRWDAANVGLVSADTTKSFYVNDNGSSFGGTGHRITGDFSNVLTSARTTFQTSTVNGSTSIGIMPNGTGTSSSVRVQSSSDLDNSAYLVLSASNLSTSIISSFAGAGAYLPLNLVVGGAVRQTITTSGETSFMNTVAVNNAVPYYDLQTASVSYGGLYASSTEVYALAREGNDFVVQTDGSNNRMRVNAAGNILMGSDVDTGGGRLQVTTTTGNNITLEKSSGGAISFTHGGVNGYQIADTSGGDLVFSASGLTERLRLTSAGVLTLNGVNVLTANQNISITGDATGSGTTAISLTLANSGVTAGTYQSSTTINPITVDAKGRITSVGANIPIVPLASPAFTGTPTVPTAAQFDDTTQIASTAFVHDARGSLRGDTTIAPGLLTVDDVGFLIGVTSGVYTLPLTSSLDFGSTYYLTCTTSTTTVACSGGELISQGGLTNATTSINQGESVLLVASAGVWRLVSLNVQDGTLLNVQTFTSSGIYTPTVGAEYIIVEATGGGGGSGGIPSSVGGISVSGGGAPGTYGRGRYAGPVSTVVTIGAGGAGGAAGANVGNPGTTTSFGALLTCPGGTGSGIGQFSSTTQFVAGATGSVGTTSGANITTSYDVGGTISGSSASQTATGARTASVLGIYGAGAAGAGAAGGGAASGIAGQNGIIIVYEYS